MLFSRYLLLAIGALLCLHTYPAPAAELNLEVTGLSAAGDLHCYVFTSAEGFPKEANARVHLVQPLQNPEAPSLTVHASVPDASEYAVMCFQDRDGDGKMNRLFGMIPQEPYGLSRNPTLFGKPKFEEAAIAASDSEHIRIILRD